MSEVDVGLMHDRNRAREQQAELCENTPDALTPCRTRGRQEGPA